MVCTIVQCRMGSIRLPGKVLMHLAGKPMLWHVINRLCHCKKIDKIIIATGTLKNNNAIEEFCKIYDIDCYRGSEDDVLDRYYQAANLFKANAIVRITADCPLIDPVVTDNVISAYIDNKNSYDGSSNVIKRTYPRGLDVEVFSFQALEKAWMQAKGNYYREHVVPYMYDSLKMKSIENKDDLSDLRWSVDEEKDLKFVQEVYSRLYKDNEIFLMDDILRVLDREPFLKEINNEVKQKIS